MARPTEKEAKNLGYSAITIRIDKDTIYKLDSFCKRKNIVRSEFIRQLIVESIK